MSNLSVSALCTHCQKTVKIKPDDFQERPVEGSAGVVALGIVCPDCQAFTLACYDSADLKRMRQQAEKAPQAGTRQMLLRTYQVQFKRLQAEMSGAAQGAA